MGKYSLIALDMDGTLFNSELKVSRANREAIESACAQGKHVVLSTGRCLDEIHETLDILPGIRYLVCENGSCVYDCRLNLDIHADPVPVTEVKHILETMKNQNVVIQIFHKNRSYFDQKDDSWAEACNVANYCGLFRKFSTFDENLFANYAEEPFQIEKLNLYFRSPAERDRVKAIFADRPLQISDSLGYMIEIVSETADKGRGLKMLCDHLNLSMEETIAMGDSMNDVTILRAAGLGAAMGNACAEAKAAADIITEDCDHDGVAKVIHEYLLDA